MDMRKINEGVIREFRSSGGRLSGPLEGAPVLLLTTTGRTSGKSHTAPVGFVDVDGRLAVAAANGGSDQHPDWYHNIRADSRVTLEVPGASIPTPMHSTIHSLATITEEPQRSDLLQKLVRSLPGMSDHVAATGRNVPVVIFSEYGHLHGSG